MRLPRAFTAVLFWAMALGASAREKPNIILIMADDLGREALSCYGSADYETPNLDAMAAEGVLFSRCYAMPLCTPSRNELMTGRENFRNYRAFQVLDPNETTFAHVLKDAGYATAVTGKWQLWGIKEDRRGTGALPEQAGFDDYLLWQVKDRQSRYADPLLERKGEAAKVHEGKYGPDLFCDFALDFMQRNRERPFLLYYPMALTHDPFCPTPDSADWATGDRNAKDTKYFKDMVEYMDKIVGRLVRGVDELGLGERTLIIFTGDNGTHPSITTRMKDGSAIRGDKGKPTQAGTHVPLIVRWTGVSAKGAVCNDLIDFADFFPTLLEAAGAALPSGHAIDGQSFLAQIRGETGNPREWIYTHYDPQWGNRKRAVYAFDERWKLYDDGRLYDMQRDPEEKNAIHAEATNDEAKTAREKLNRVIHSMR